MKAVPDQPTEIPSKWGSAFTVSPPWDLAWQPAGDTTRGACAGCPARVVFGNEPAPRCIDSACYSAKAKAWPEEDFARQRAAARRILDDLHGSNLLVNALADSGPRRVEILDQPVKDTYRLKDKLHIFNPSVTEEAVIIDNNLCGPHCQCFAACFEEPSRYYSGTSYRSARWQPAPDVAPDIVYCCTDPACVAEHIKAAKGEAEQRRQAQQAQRDAALNADPDYVARRRQREAEEAARRQEIREANAQAQRLADSAVAAAGGADSLWTNHGFLVDLVRLLSSNYYNPPARSELAGKTVADLRAMIIERILIDQFRSAGLSDLAAVQALANRIVPPPSQPGPGDSQSTNWQTAWDIEDECAYQNIMAAWDGSSWSHLAALVAGAAQQQDAPTARTLLRLIEACPDKAVRGQLWQQHNNI